MKNLKKKILLSTLSLVFFSFLVFPSLSFAAATLTVTNQTSNSVTLKADGLTVGQSYHIGVYNNLGVVKSYWDLNSVTDSTKTTTSPNTLPLASGTYTAKISDQTPAIIATSTPFTISGSNSGSSSIAITVSPIESVKATVNVIGLILNDKYEIGVYDNSLSTPVYNNHILFTGTGASTEPFNITGLHPGGHYTAYVLSADPNLPQPQFPLTTSNFITLQDNNSIPPNITASHSDVTATSAKITIKINQYGTSFFPIKLGLAWGKVLPDGSVQVQPLKVLDTENIIPGDLPYTFDTTLTLEPGSNYSYRIVPIGTNGQYTDIQTISTNQRWTFVDTAGQVSDPYNTKAECDAARSGYIEAQTTPPTIPECTPYVEPVVVVHTCPTGQTWDTVINACAHATVDTTNNSNTGGNAVILIPGLVPCSKNCGFNELIQLINNFIKFILFVMAVPIAAIMFVYAGFEMVTSGGSAEKAKKAKNIFVSAAFGLAIAAASWLIVELILSTLGYSGSWIGF